MLSINELPSELLLAIFEQLQQSSSSGMLPTAMLCCHKWHHLISSILYSRVAVGSKLNETSTASLFARQSSYLHCVHSFSLKFHQVHLLGFSMKFAKAHDRLAEICAILPRMKNLKSFSLTLEEERSKNNLLPSKALIDVLRSLPKTVANLEVDCSGLDDIAFSGLHACEAIGNLLPQLHWLRLRISHICPTLLARLQGTDDPESDSMDHEGSSGYVSKEATSALRYATIRLDAAPNSLHATTAHRCHPPGGLIYAPDLASTLKSLHRRGAFPSLRRFILINRVNPTPEPHGEQWNVFKVRDITRELTMTFPWCARGGQSYLHMIRDLSGTDWFGSFDDISNALEGHLSWSESPSRCRGPPPHSTLSSTKETWALDLRGLTEREKVVQRHGVNLRLWEHEGLTGRRLMGARVERGFGDEGAVREVLPGGWGWVREGRWNWGIEWVG